MAKKKKSSSFKGLGIADTLIDLAGGAAMNAVANHMEKKYHYSAKGKINPYRVSAIGIATGRMKTTRDIMRTGAYLGAKGSFNITTDPPELDPNIHQGGTDTIISDDPLLNAISDTIVHDNQYAWRLNCESGWKYGICPDDYETREEYNLALNMAKLNEDMEQANETVIKNDAEADGYPAANANKQLHCRISRLDNGKTEAFWIDNPDVKVGDVVEVMAEAGLVQGIVVLVENE